jgi:hypothetical protein
MEGGQEDTGLTGNILANNRENQDIKQEPSGDSVEENDPLNNDVIGIKMELFAHSSDTDADVDVCPEKIQETGECVVTDRNTPPEHETKQSLLSYGIDSQQCDICNYTCSTMYYLKIHSKTAHKGELGCNICEFVAVKKHDLLVHRQNNHACPQCPTMAFTKSELQKHCRTKHINRGRSFKCERCDFSASSSLALTTHHHSVHGVKCKFCDFFCINKKGDLTKLMSNLKKHIQLEHKQLSICCKQMFPDLAALNIHNRTFHKKGFQCDMCSYKAPGAIQLKRHHKNGHKKCDLCPGLTFSPFSLQAHNRSHHMHTRPPCKDLNDLTFCPLQERWKCCEETFPDQAALDIHNATSHKDGFQCDICSYKAPGVWQLKCHHQNANGHFKCKLCPGLKFSLLSLQAHNRSEHMNTRLVQEGTYQKDTLQCDTCSYETPEISHLKKHHLEGHFKCTFCPGLHLHATNLKRHIRLEHLAKFEPMCSKPGRWLKCCDTKFLYLDALGEHIRLKHMEKLETLLVVDPLEEEVRKDHSRAEEEIAFKTEMECDEPQCILPD